MSEGREYGVRMGDNEGKSDPMVYITISDSNPDVSAEPEGSFLCEQSNSRIADKCMQIFEMEKHPLYELQNGPLRGVPYHVDRSIV